MILYSLAGRPFFFHHALAGLESFEAKDADDITLSFPELFFENGTPALICRTTGWVAGAQRLVEVYDLSGTMILKVEGGGDFFIASSGETIYKQNPAEELSNLDCEIILGPALVLALALHGVWCLHTGAVQFADAVTVFLGESGQGKSTLAGYLSASPGWRLVADDILPIKMDAEQVWAFPHFPQLKLPWQAQPGPGLPERLLLTRLCVLTPAGQDAMPELRLLPPVLAVQALLSHTAGTRMFTPEMLGKHLSFCSQVAGQMPVYQLTYPHRRDTLPGIRDLLEYLC